MTFKDQKKRVETHVRGEVTPTVITNRMLEKEPYKAFELLGEYFNTVRDNNGLPLSAWCRASSKLIPTVSGDDPSDEYIALDRELVLRYPIIKETRHGHHGQTIYTLEETRSAWTDEFKSSNPILWEQLFQILVKMTVWEHPKKTQTLKNGRKAYRTILLALFGDNIVFFRSERHKKEIIALTYKG